MRETQHKRGSYGKSGWWERQRGHDQEPSTVQPLPMALPPPHHPHTQTLSPAPTQSQQRWRDLYSYKANPLEIKREKHTERWVEMYHDKERESEGCASLEMESSECAGKKWEGERASEGGRKRERVENSVAVAQGCVLVYSSSLLD